MEGDKMNFGQLQKAIEILKEGIRNGNMEQISEGYYELTGEEAKPRENTPEESVQREDEEVQKPEVLQEQTTKQIDFSIKHKKEERGKSEPVVAGQNTFVDDGTEHNDEENVTPNVTLTPRRRKPYEPKSVNCHVCGKSYKVNPSLLSGEFYRCDSCVGTK